MKPNSLKSHISVLEKETVTKDADKKAEQQTPVINPPKKEAEAVIQTDENKNFFSANTFEKQKPVVDKQQFKDWPKEIKQQKPEEQPDITEDFIKLEKPKAKKKQFKFRTKVLTAVYCIVIAVCAGWITTNAVRLSNISNTISQNQSVLSTNEIKFIQKISELDDLKDQAPNVENSDLIPIEEFINVNPLPLEDVTGYEKQSNWFDNIVNWFGNLFGG